MIHDTLMVFEFSDNVQYFVYFCFIRMIHLSIICNMMYTICNFFIYCAYNNVCTDGLEPRMLDIRDVSHLQSFFQMFIHYTSGRSWFGYGAQQGFGAGPAGGL